jgi:enoyl-CoA hydratase/carnithine racemase
VSELRYEQDGRVVTLTLDRPERKNALSARLVSDLIVAVERAGEDASVGAVVVTGAGGTFCSGGDLSQMGGSAGGAPLRGGFAELNLALWACPKPIVAKVRGYALAGGLALVCGAHFAYAEATATFGAPEIQRGLFPMMVTASLMRCVPRRRALELVLLGDRIDAAEAERIGLVTRTLAPDALDAHVDAVARRLAHNPPAVTRLGLEALRAQEDLAFDAAMPLLSGKLLEVLGTEDAREGLMAFLQKRPPAWF